MAEIQFNFKDITEQKRNEPPKPVRLAAYNKLEQALNTYKDPIALIGPVYSGKRTAMHQLFIEYGTEKSRVVKFYKGADKTALRIVAIKYYTEDVDILFLEDITLVKELDKHLSEFIELFSYKKIKLVMTGSSSLIFHDVKLNPHNYDLEYVQFSPMWYSDMKKLSPELDFETFMLGRGDIMYKEGGCYPDIAAQDIAETIELSSQSMYKEVIHGKDSIRKALDILYDLIVNRPKGWKKFLVNSAAENHGCLNCSDYRIDMNEKELVEILLRLSDLFAFKYINVRPFADRFRTMQELGTEYLVPKLGFPAMIYRENNRGLNESQLENLFKAVMIAQICYHDENKFIIPEDEDFDLVVCNEGSDWSIWFDFVYDEKNIKEKKLPLYVSDEGVSCTVYLKGKKGIYGTRMDAEYFLENIDDITYSYLKNAQKTNVDTEDNYLLEDINDLLENIDISGNDIPDKTESILSTRGRLADLLPNVSDITDVLPSICKFYTKEINRAEMLAKYTDAPVIVVSAMFERPDAFLETLASRFDKKTLLKIRKKCSAEELLKLKGNDAVLAEGFSELDFNEAAMFLHGCRPKPVIVSVDKMSMAYDLCGADMKDNMPLNIIDLNIPEYSSEFGSFLSFACGSLTSHFKFEHSTDILEYLVHFIRPWMNDLSKDIIMCVLLGICEKNREKTVKFTWLDVRNCFDWVYTYILKNDNTDLYNRLEYEVGFVLNELLNIGCAVIKPVYQNIEEIEEIFYTEQNKDIKGELVIVMPELFNKEILLDCDIAEEDIDYKKAAAHILYGQVRKKLEYSCYSLCGMKDKTADFVIADVYNKKFVNVYTVEKNYSACKEEEGEKNIFVSFDDDFVSDKKTRFSAADFLSELYSIINS